MTAIDPSTRDEAQRRAVRRTVAVVGGVALLIYLAFLASGIIGR